MIENEKLDFFSRQIMLSELADYYINKNKFDRANELIQKNCYIDDWKYTGIFNYSYYNDLEHDFSQIEKNIVSHPDNKIKWTILPYKTDHGWVPLEFLAGNKSGSIYTTTYFYLPKDMTIILWLTSEATVKTFVDGQVLFVNDASQYNYYLNNIFKITLKQGWHNLLVKSVKIHNSFDFKCRLINEKGKPINGIKFLLTRQVVKPNNNISKRIYSKVYQFFADKIENNSKEVLDYFKFCLFNFHYFNENKALKNLERYIQMQVKNPLMNYLAGRIYMHKYNTSGKNDFLEKAKYYFSRAAASSPNFLKVNKYLVKYQIKKENPDKVYESLKELNNPSATQVASRDTTQVALRSYDLWSDYFSMINWDMMELKHYLLEKAKNPGKYYYKYVLSNYFENLDINKSLAIHKNLEKNSFQYMNEYDFLNIYLKQNNMADFNILLDKLLKQYKYNEDYYIYKAHYEKKSGNHDKAISILRDFLEIKPSFKTTIELGDLMELKGDTSSALKYYKSGYNLRPYDVKLYKKISFLEKNKIFHSLEDEYYKINTEKIVAQALQDKNENEERIKMYLDMLIIKPFPEGGYTYLFHQIYKILDEEGKGDFGEIKIPAENSYIINVRNHLGKEIALDGVDYKEHNKIYYISLPELKIGSVVEVCYQVFYPYNWLDKTKYFYFTPFSFQETDYNMENSILILVENNNIPKVKSSIKNGQSIEYKKKSTDKGTIHIWKKQDCPRLKKEINSVPVFDIFPHIYLSAIPDWNAFYNWYYGKACSRIKINLDMEQKIFEIFESSKLRNKFNIPLYLKNCYYFIQENIIPSYAFLYYPEQVELIYARRKGNTEEKTLLMYSFLKQLRIECDLVLVRNNQYSKFDFSLVYPEAFNSILLHIPKQKGLKEGIFLDFSKKHLPFGIINNNFVRTTGLLINDKNFKFINTPEFSNEDTITGNFQTIISTNVININGNIIYSGLFNMNKENYTVFAEKESKIIEYIKSLIKRISILDYSITNLNQFDKNMEISFEGELFLEKKVSIIFDKFELSKRYVSLSQRKTPLKIYYPFIKTIINKISIDQKYNLNIKNLHIKNNFGEYKINVEKNEENIIIKRHINIHPRIVDIKDYNKFLEFCREIDNIEKEELELL